MCFGAFTGQWALGGGRWCSGTGPSCSSDTPALLNPHASTRHAGTRQLPCLPLLSRSWTSSQRRTGVHSWGARVVQKTGKLGWRLGQHSSSCRQALKQGWEVKVILSPAEPKASHSPPGTSNSTPGSVGMGTEQTALTQSSATLPLDSTNICIWNQTEKHQHGFRFLCFTEEDVCLWGAEKNTEWTTW